jgi:cold shock protein
MNGHMSILPLSRSRSREVLVSGLLENGDRPLWVESRSDAMRERMSAWTFRFLKAASPIPANLSRSVGGHERQLWVESGPFWRDPSVRLSPLELKLDATNCVTKEGKTTLAHGTVKVYNLELGYGFLKPDDGGPDAFFHHSDLRSAGLATPQVGNRFFYELGPGRNGQRMKAINLRPIDVKNPSGAKSGNGGRRLGGSIGAPRSANLKRSLSRLGRQRPCGNGGPFVLMRPDTRSWLLLSALGRSLRTFSSLALVWTD